jgi:predicted dehydrogenase
MGQRRAEPTVATAAPGAHEMADWSRSEADHTDTLRFGVIGYGYWGPHLVRNISGLEHSRMEFIADPDEARLRAAKASFRGAQVTRDAADALASEIDAVFIATPVHTHYALARAALLAGKHVYVEKPLAPSVEQVRELVALAAAHGRVLMVGYTFLYHPTVRELRRMIVAGQLGKLFYIDSQRLNLGRIQRDVNVIWDLAPHDLSVLRYLLDADPIAVSATGRSHIRSGNEDLAYIHLRYADDMSAHLQLSWLHPSKVRRFTVVGDRLMALYDDVEPQDKLRIYNRGVDREPYSTTFEEFQLSYRSGDITIPTIPWVEPLHVACQHFADCIRTGQRPLSDGRWSIPICQTIEAIHRSLEQGGAEIAL